MGRGGPRFSSGGRLSANLVTSTPSETTLATSFDPITNGFFCDEIEALRHFMSSLDTSTSTPQSSFAHSGTFAAALSASIFAPGQS